MGQGTGDSPWVAINKWGFALQFDTNGDGQISMAELREAMRKLLGQQLNYREVDEILKDVDLNGDGLVDFEGMDQGKGLEMSSGVFEMFSTCSSAGRVCEDDVTLSVAKPRRDPSPHHALRSRGECGGDAQFHLGPCQCSTLPEPQGEGPRLVSAGGAHAHPRPCTEVQLQHEMTPGPFLAQTWPHFGHSCPDLSSSCFHLILTSSKNLKTGPHPSNCSPAPLARPPHALILQAKRPAPSRLGFRAGHPV